MEGQSKIPMLKKRSAIPVRVSSSKGILRPSLIARAPNKKLNIITPVVTKCDPKHKGPLKVNNQLGVKKKLPVSAASEQKPMQNKYRQSVLPKNYLDKRLLNVNNATAQLEKENVSPDSHSIKVVKKSPPKRKGMSLVEMQKDLDIDFVPNESLKKQILENRPITFKQIGFNTPSLASKNSFGNSLSLSKNPKNSLPKKPLKRLSSAKKFSGSDTTVQKNLIDLFSRRATWNSDCPKRQLLCSPKPTPYEVAMERIRRLSLTRANSATGPKMKEKSLTVQNDDKPELYITTMKRIEALSLYRRSLGGTLPKPTNSVQKTPVRIHTPVQKSPKIDLFAKTPSSQAKVVSSVYRPLTNFMNNLESQQKKSRLTDISERSENDSCSSLQADTQKSESSLTLHDASKMSDSQRFSLHAAWMSRQSLQRNFPDGRYSHSNKETRETKANSSTVIHTPRPVSLYANHKQHLDQAILLNAQTSPLATHNAPICTPLVLQSIARRNEEEDLWNPIKQKLDFGNAPTPAFGDGCRQSSSLRTKNIITKKMQEELLADEECRNTILSRPIYSTFPQRLVNPVAKILSEGDFVHFVPIGPGSL